MDKEFHEKAMKRLEILGKHDSHSGAAGMSVHQLKKNFPKEMGQNIREHELPYWDKK